MSLMRSVTCTIHSIVQYWAQILGLGFASILLSGCLLAATTGGVVGSALVGTQASLAFTKKLPTDHIAESVTDLDCDFNRSMKDGGYLCRPKNAQIVEAPIYCYKTLGRVDCYRQAIASETPRLVE